jgi:hypothetical protein
MGKIDDIHQAEYEAQPGGHQKQHHPHGEARDGKGQISTEVHTQEGQQIENNGPSDGKLRSPTLN